MPRAFSDYEKETLRSQILEKGQKLFEVQGLRKTTVDELTETVGISKGAFYLFYGSKEELYLDILEQIETEIKTRILELAIHPQADAHQNVSNLLKRFLLTMDAYPLLKNLSKSDFDYLVRKLPAERVLQHANSDEAFTNELIKKIECEGIKVAASPRVVDNLIKSIFFIVLHREDFDGEAFEEMMDVLIHLIAGYVAGEYNEIRN
jgi:AcrR family transcriptional regulator